MTECDIQTTGKARGVLVFGHGDNLQAVTSAIVVRSIERTNRQRLYFSGTVEFTASLKRHIRQVILPMIDRICWQLDLSEGCYEISAVNLGAASAIDTGLKVSGFSADLPLFVAMLSAAIAIPVADDFVSTGHISSIEGSITAVKAIPAKLQAACVDDSVERFICPDLESDGSLKTLSPRQRTLSIDAMMAAREAVRVITIKSVTQLVMEVFTEQEIVKASLRKGFFEISRIKDSSPLADMTNYLTEDNENRFWNILQQCFLSNQSDIAIQLLLDYAKFHLRGHVYPVDFGSNLYRLLCSLPPRVRSLNIDFPVLKTAVCIELATLACQSDYPDVPLLFEAAGGRGLDIKTDSKLSEPEPEPDPETLGTDCRVFDAVASLISEQSLAEKFGIAIDTARSSFVLASSTIQSYEKFIDTLQAFYIHLQRFVDDSGGRSLDLMKARSETIALLERTFENEGSDQAVFARVRDGVKGGMRLVLDQVTEQYKSQKQAEYIQRVFKDAVSAMDWNGRVDFMRGAMKRLANFLPPELRDQPPQRFVRNFEAIVQAYVGSLDKVKQFLRTM